MKSVILLCFLSLLPRGVLAQQRLSDSLQHRLTQPLADTTRVQVLDRLGRALMYSQPVVAMQHAQEGLRLAQRIGYAGGEARIQNRIGTIFRLTGNYDRSLAAHLASVKLAKATHDRDALARTYNNLGNLYVEQNDWPKAIGYFRQARTLAAQLGDRDLQQTVLLNLGFNYASQKQLDSALKYTQLAYETAVELHYTDLQTELLNLGNVNKQVGRHQQALTYYRQSVPYGITMQNGRILSQAYIEMAEVFQAINQRDSAIYYATGALRVAQASQIPLNVRYAGQLLTKLYEPTDPRRALTYLKLASVATDSLVKSEKTKNFQNIESNEKIRLDDAQRLEAAYQTRIVLYSLAGGVGTLLLLALLLYRNNRQQQRANGVLTQQRDEIGVQRQKAETTLMELTATQAQLIQREKLASLGELTAGIAHEIQNPLNFVNNFAEVSVDLVGELKIELANGEVAEAGFISDDLGQNLQKIAQHGKRASSIVRNMLEHTRASTGERRLTDLNALCGEYLRLVYHGQLANGKNGAAGTVNVAMETDFDPLLEPVDLVPQDMGRVLLNLFTNAFYAARQRANGQSAGPDSPYRPTVRVSTKQTGGQVCIEVRDNGTGMPERVMAKVFQPFFTTKPTGEGTGLGLSLSYDIVTKGHGGRLDVESREGEGTAFTVKLPR